MTDGYPTQGEIKKIKEWSYRDPIGLFEYLKDLWRWPDYLQIKRQYVYLSTGGWSGHEEMVHALKKNKNMFWFVYWESSRRGGHYRFDLTRKPKE